MVKPVLIYPNQILKAASAPIAEITSELSAVVTDLKDTMLAAGHSVGIAAAQIGVLSRVVVINASLGRKPCENHGELVLINPEIIDYEGIFRTREGCMSVPEFTGDVNRAAKITVSYLDEALCLKTLSTEGFEAVVIQHEIDHLDGVLFIDRVISRKRDLYRRKDKKC
ncbi:MAG: peptide deformylase [Deferribacteraceae bacterium]|nr:peptide deformylase [Deferribacteraceae bacterium]